MMHPRPTKVSQLLPENTKLRAMINSDPPINRANITIGTHGALSRADCGIGAV